MNTVLTGEMRQVLRSAARRPAFSAGIVVTLALVIGAGTGICSAIYGILLRPLPFPEPDRLVYISESNHVAGTSHLAVGTGAFGVLEKENRVFDGIAGCYWVPPAMLLSERLKMLSSHLWGTREAIQGTYCSSQLFPVLRAAPLIGRTFTAGEDVYTKGAPSVAILSFAFWQTHFGGDPNIVGKTLSEEFSGERSDSTIIGVMPASFEFPYPFWPVRVDFWTNLQMPPQFEPGNSLGVVARLKRGMKIEQARADLESVGAQLRSEQPKYFGNEYLDVAPLQDELVRNAGDTIIALIAALGGVLLIGCSNIGCLLLVHGNRRRKEMAVRAALGASRMALVRQIMLETLCLAVVGSAVGFALAAAVLRVVAHSMPSTIYIPRFTAVVLDTRILVFSAGISVLAILLVGALPALKLGRPDIAEELKSTEGQASRTSMFKRSGNLLIACEVCMALVLVTGTALLTKSVRRFLATNEEYQPEHFISMNVAFTNGYIHRTPAIDTVQQVLYSQFREKIGAMPGVRSVTFVDSFPLLSLHEDPNQVKETGGEGAISMNFLPAEAHIVDPSFSKWAHFKIVRGRWLADSDGPKDAPVAVINSAMEQRYFANRDPLGARIEPFYRYTDKRELYTVVGVVEEPKRFGTGLDAEPAVFFSMNQIPVAGRSVLVRTSENPAALIGPMREAALAIVPGEMSVGNFRTGQDVLSDSTARARFMGTLLSAFSGLALILTLAGIYALVSYDTARRTREVGIRMTLGATSARVMRMIFLETVFPILVGIGAGAVAAHAFGRSLSAMLYGVSPADFASFGIAAVAIVAVAAIASYVPARRAASVEPLKALRYE
jgi:putative ABC transport system permease protein